MNTIARYGGAAALCLLGFLGCGDNLTPSDGLQFGPPKSLKAYAIDSSAVHIEWSAADGSTDSTFAGYQVEYLGKTEQLSKSVQTMNFTNLPAGLVKFVFRSRSTDGRVSDTTSISWAGAARFENSYTLLEFVIGGASRLCALDVGHAARNPMVMSLTEPNAGQLVDIFLASTITGTVGEGGPLRLYSASIYAPAYPVAIFSQSVHASATLNYPLASYPGTYDSLSVAVTDNSIYYVLIGGPNATTYAARLHVRLLGGTYPNRTVAINVSLQRSPGLLLAEAVADRAAGMAMIAPALSAIP
jgi:hypothetical protein